MRKPLEAFEDAVSLGVVRANIRQPKEYRCSFYDLPEEDQKALANLKSDDIASVRPDIASLPAACSVFGRRGTL